MSTLFIVYITFIIVGVIAGFFSDKGKSYMTTIKSFYTVNQDPCPLFTDKELMSDLITMGSFFLALAYTVFIIIFYGHYGIALFYLERIEKKA